MAFSLPQALVVGTDFSLGADSAVRLAMALGRLCGASVEVVHAVAAPLAAEGASVLQAALANAATLARPDGVSPPPTASVVTGPAATVLRDAAAGRPDAWILVGCEGSSATFSRRPGSVTAALLAGDGAGVPVLVAPPSWGTGHGRTRRRLPRLGGHVLVGVKGDDRDLELLAAGARLATLAGDGRGSVALAHVLDLTPSRDWPSALRRGPRDESVTRAAEARERLADLVDASPELPPEDRHRIEMHVVRQGPPATDLAGLAESQSMDLLVAGAGATAVRLAGITGRPLLALPSPSGRSAAARARG